MHRSKNMLLRTFAIQQLSLAAMHPIQTKTLEYHWAFTCRLALPPLARPWLHMCVCRWAHILSCLGLNILVQPASCIHRSFISLSSLALPSYPLQHLCLSSSLPHFFPRSDLAATWPVSHHWDFYSRPFLYSSF